MCSYSVVSNSLQPHGVLSVRLLCPWNSPGKNTGAGCHFLLQGIFPIQGSNPLLLRLLHCRQLVYHCTTWETFFKLKNDLSGALQQLAHSPLELQNELVDILSTVTNFLGFPGVLAVKNRPATAGTARDVGLIPGSGRYCGKGSGNSLRYSCRENPMDREAWQATVHRIIKNQTRLSD